MTIRAVIADDHPMCREAARMALEAVRPDATSLYAGSLAEVRALAPEADLLLLDLGLPDSRGLLGMIEMRRTLPDLPILVVTGSENPDVERQTLAAGARGFVSKAQPIDAMIAALRSILAGGTWFSEAAKAAPADGGQGYERLATLTGAQSRVLAAMSAGGLNKQIAFDLGLSEVTIKAHAKAIFRKLGVINRTQAVLMLRNANGEDAELRTRAVDPNG